MDLDALPENPLKRLACYRRARAEEMLTTFIEEMRSVARSHGYALAVHGSLARDLDLIAVPWQKECSGADALITAFEVELGLVATRRGVPKPHSRLGYILHGRRWRGGDEHQPIDVSVMPIS